jgi:lipoate---protein ligase
MSDSARHCQLSTIHYQLAAVNLLELTCPTPAENLACDEALLLWVDEQFAAAAPNASDHPPMQTPGAPLAARPSIQTKGVPLAARPPVRTRGDATSRTSHSIAAEASQGSADAPLPFAVSPFGWLRLWESPECAVILGRSNRVQEDVKVAACRRDGVPILRRCSGGGAVVLGPGCLAFTLILPISPEHHLQGIQAATAAILRRIADALMGISSIGRIEVCGTSDLAMDGLKFSGNSQRWRRWAMLHHGTLLYDFDIARVSRYLHLPRRQPEYRGWRDHGDFLVNLPVARQELRQALITAWQARPHQMPVPVDTTAELARTRYQMDDWNLRL